MKLGKAQRNKKQEQRTTYKKEQRTKNKEQRTKNKEQRTKNKEHIIALRTMIEKNKARSFLSFLLCYFSFLFFAKKGMEPW
jgi:hypothetical protein